MSRKTIKNLEQKIETLEAEKINDKTEKQDLVNEYEKKINVLKDEHSSEIEELEQQVESLTKENKDKQDQINKDELKKLAKAYLDQENNYKEERNNWFTYVKISFILLLVSVLISVIMSIGQNWYDRLEYYFINFVSLTFLVFSLKQYSYYNKLKTDYANRKTIAQSYHNILSSVEDVDIKENFVNKAVDVLVAKSEVSDEANTIPEKVLEGVIEITKTLSKKV